MKSYTGGCLCRKIQYRATGTPMNPSHCHCELCRKSSGAPLVSWASFRTGDFSFTQGNPARFDSSPIAFRQFCPDCGTQLTFQFHRSPDSIDVTLGSLDHPETITPADHIWTKRQIPWIKLADGLPRFETNRPTGDE
jgi:hypothetical protein